MRIAFLRSGAVLALALLMLAALAGSGSARPAKSASSALLSGVNVPPAAAGSTPAEADRTIAAAHSLHVKLVRTDVRWAAFQPNGPGSFDARSLAFLDRLVSDASAAGMRVIVTLQASPCWASSAPSRLLASCDPSVPGPANAWSPTVPATYGAFAAFIARRYGARLAALEVWNEPDQSNEDYFAGPNKPARYAAVLRAAYTAVKRAAPSLPVLAGSLVGSNGAFLRALYAAGIKGFYDGLAVHFYDMTIASLRSIRTVQLANGDQTPLWLAEFGWPSCWPHQRVQEEQACVPPRTQALNLTNTFRELARTPYVAAAVVYKLQDSGGEELGLLSRTFKHKPAFAAVQRALLSPFGPISPVTLSLHTHGNRVIASGSGPVGDFLELEAFQGATLRYRAVLLLNRFDDYSLALPAVLGTSGLRVRIFQYLRGPSGATQKSI